ncbi:hypothetical protein ANACOL_03568 [Anaerotruncus colihominis DSM 17241]|uniref:Uncharacterized protein n=1 Tax=Anaerotruncus colihominis DSM 17241 TaxID=445972 RepID=B0PFI8_9FIRM|nr:hypothetical protein ANACOL_03568 [Anaerotruncus colihominis DSM 17241]
MRVGERFCGGHFLGHGVMLGIMMGGFTHHFSVYLESKQG